MQRARNVPAPDYRRFPCADPKQGGGRKFAARQWQIETLAILLLLTHLQSAREAKPLTRSIAQAEAEAEAAPATEAAVTLDFTRRGRQVFVFPSLSLFLSLSVYVCKLWVLAWSTTTMTAIGTGRSSGA